MNRSVMQRQMFQQGGPVMDMPPQEAGIEQLLAQQGPAMDMPPQGAGIEQLAAQQGLDVNALEGELISAEEKINQVDTAVQNDDLGGMMDALRSNPASVEERRGELAGVVGERDAMETPDSVLALLQPVMEMASVDGGIGALAQGVMDTPIEGDMAGGIMSTIDMSGAGGAPEPIGFQQGGVVPMGAPEQSVNIGAPQNSVNIGAPMAQEPMVPRREPMVPRREPIAQEPVAQEPVAQEPVVPRRKLVAQTPGSSGGTGGNRSRVRKLYDQELALYREILGTGNTQEAQDQKKRVYQAKMLADFADQGRHWKMGTHSSKDSKIGQYAAEFAKDKEALTNKDDAIKLAALKSAQSQHAAAVKAAAVKAAAVSPDTDFKIITGPNGENLAVDMNNPAGGTIEITGAVSPEPDIEIITGPNGEKIAVDMNMIKVNENGMMELTGGNPKSDIEHFIVGDKIVEGTIGDDGGIIKTEDVYGKEPEFIIPGGKTDPLGNEDVSPDSSEDVSPDSSEDYKKLLRLKGTPTILFNNLGGLIESLSKGTIDLDNPEIRDARNYLNNLTYVITSELRNTGKLSNQERQKLEALSAGGDDLFTTPDQIISKLSALAEMTRRRIDFSNKTSQYWKDQEDIERSKNEIENTLPMRFIFEELEPIMLLYKTNKNQLSSDEQNAKNRAILDALTRKIFQQ